MVNMHVIKICVVILGHVQMYPIIHTTRPPHTSSVILAIRLMLSRRLRMIINVAASQL